MRRRHGAAPSVRVTRSWLIWPPPNKSVLRLLRSVAPGGNVWVVATEPAVPTGWLELLRQPGVHLTVCDSVSARPALGSVVDALREHLSAPAGEEIATLVLLYSPVLAPAATLVHLVCRHPWRIRRPHELAEEGGAGLGRVRAVCRALGFARIEHFIVAVRELAAELLARERGCSLQAARRAVGFCDPSNAITIVSAWTWVAVRQLDY